MTRTDWLDVLLAATVVLRELGAGIICGVTGVTFPTRHRLGLVPYAKFTRAQYREIGVKAYGAAYRVGRVADRHRAHGGHLVARPAPVDLDDRIVAGRHRLGLRPRSTSPAAHVRTVANRRRRPLVGRATSQPLRQGRHLQRRLAHRRSNKTAVPILTSAADLAQLSSAASHRIIRTADIPPRVSQKSAHIVCVYRYLRAFFQRRRSNVASSVSIRRPRPPAWPSP